MLKLVCFVYLVHLVCLVEPNKQDKPNKPNNGLLLLAGFFSILLKRAARNLLIVGFQHDRAGWFDNHQLALIKGVGAI